MLNKLLLLILLASLVACTPFNAPPLEPINWQAHQAEINAYQQWNLQGRLNIRSEADSNTLNIHWQQEDENFLINLSGTLGFGAVAIEGNNQLVKIEKSGDAPVFANNLEEISSSYLGFEFPANQLYYWIRGIPSPMTEQASIQLFNEEQLLETLQQDQWLLHYDRYKTQDNGLILPGRIRVERPPYRLTFIIRQW